MSDSLFDACDAVSLGPGAGVLPGFASGQAGELLDGVHQVVARAPWRHLVTPGGAVMSVAMSNCGSLGWFSDRRGYRYVEVDPQTGQTWPAMPAGFAALARAAAARFGFDDFDPDACLINRYEPGSRLSLHQDRDEQDASAPIVSVSLGVPAMFLWGGGQRTDKPRRMQLQHGDVVVWGGPSRFRFHGIAPVKPAWHPGTGQTRVNLTFRRVLKMSKNHEISHCLPEF